MAGCPTLKGSWPLPWPWIGSYYIPSWITHRPLPTCQISLKSKKLFVDRRTDVRRNVRADEHLRPALLGRLCNNNNNNNNADLAPCRHRTFKPSQATWAVSLPVGAVVHSRHRHLLLLPTLPSPTANIHFIVPRRVQGWVDLGTRVTMYSPFPRLYISL